MIDPRCVLLLATTTTVLGGGIVQAQITLRPSFTTTPVRVASLEEQLINRLKATTPPQQAYIRYVVRLVDEEKLDVKLVVAIERYAIRRNPKWPFPFFERALRFEAAKRDVRLPPIKHFNSARNRLLEPTP